MGADATAVFLKRLRMKMISLLFDTQPIFGPRAPGWRCNRVYDVLANLFSEWPCLLINLKSPGMSFDYLFIGLEFGHRLEL